MGTCVGFISLVDTGTEYLGTTTCHRGSSVFSTDGDIITGHCYRLLPKMRIQQPSLRHVTFGFITECWVTHLTHSGFGVVLRWFSNSAPAPAPAGFRKLESSTSLIKTNKDGWMGGIGWNIIRFLWWPKLFGVTSFLNVFFFWYYYLLHILSIVLDQQHSTTQYRSVICQHFWKDI